MDAGKRLPLYTFNKITSAQIIFRFFRDNLETTTVVALSGMAVRFAFDKPLPYYYHYYVLAKILFRPEQAYFLFEKTD